MKGLTSAFLLVIAVAAPATISAAGQQLSMTIRGESIATPIVITDPEAMRKFRIGDGPGNWRNGGPECDAAMARSYSKSFIVDWAKGPVEQPTGEFVHYQVEFPRDLPGDKTTYRVTWLYDPAKRTGFVSIPGTDDPRYEENIWLIRRFVEGNWYHAWSDREAFATGLLHASH